MSGEAPLWDVAIVGGGPAGAAAALTLRRHAPHLKVGLLEAGRYRDYRPGEVIAPPARAILAQLRVLLAVEEARFLPAPGTLVAWEMPAPFEQHSILSARGEGWIVDRREFDRLLATEAAKMGTEVILGCRVTQASRRRQTWQLTCSDERTRTARFLILATGRRWNLIRSTGARLTTSDRLFGNLRIVSDTADGYPGLVVEASKNGWWYTVPLPENRRIVVWMTDADLLDRRDKTVWGQSLSETQLVRSHVSGSAQTLFDGSYFAATSRLDHAAGDGWVAAGDVAAAFDPLSAQGVAKALRAGVFAAYAVSDALSGDEAAACRFSKLVGREWAAHGAARTAVYGRVHRWPHELFWQRRQGSSV